MEKRRPLTFSAGIVNIVAFAIYILLTAFVGYVTILALALLIDFSSELDATATASILSLAGTCILRLALAIASIIMSAKLIKLSKASVQDYNSAKSKILSVVIINFIIVVYGLLSYVTSGIDESMLLISIGEILMFVAMLVVAILLIVDMNKNKKLAVNEQAQIIASTTSTPAEEVSSTDTKLEELEKLNQMKADGLITEEEYDKMKADLLNK